MGDQIVEYFPAGKQNYTVGRAGEKIEIVMIHYTATMATALENCRHFHNNYAGASAHYFVDRDGYMMQSVLEKDTAWAAGNLDVNQRAAHIEFISDGRPFTKMQINNGGVLVRDIMKRNKLGEDALQRHYDTPKLARWGKILDPWKKCPYPYIDTASWFMLKRQLLGKVNMPKYSQIEVDGVIGPQSVIALQRVLGVHPSGIIQGQGKGWEPHHKGISKSCIEYHNSNNDVKGCDVIAALQRVCGKDYLDRSGVLTKHTISKWQEQRGMTPDGYFGPVTAKVTQRWINKWLKEYGIKLK